MDRPQLGSIFAGGFVGAVARAEVDVWLPIPSGGWPWGTFLVNVLGAFLLGFLSTRLPEPRGPSGYLRPLLATGFCGALTTFSTLELELLHMLDAGEIALALAYAAASVAAGLLAVLTASDLGRPRRLRS